MAEDADYQTLTDAMLAGDELAEAIMRYRAIAEAFADSGAREKKSLSVELNTLMEKITRLRAQKQPLPSDLTGEREKWGKVVPIDDRFRQVEKEAGHAR